MNKKVVFSIALLVSSVFSFFYFDVDKKIANFIVEKKIYDIAETSFRNFARSSCKKPLSYKIGDIDSRFNISEEKLTLLLKEAEDIWESQTGHNLFTYKPEDEDAVVVSMIFDERQESLISEKMSRKDLENKWGSYETLSNTYEKLISEFENKRDSFDRRVNEYNIALERYNKKTTAWNKNGGSEAEYRNLLKEKENVDSLFNSLNKEQKDITESSRKLTELGEILNNLYVDFANKTDRHNENLKGGTVEVGVYESYKINIYQYENAEDLKITLAHELGHSLGLDHVEGEQSLMYYLHPEIDVSNPKLSAMDIEELNDVCRF